MKRSILVIDDEQDIRTLIQGILEDEGYLVQTAGNARDGLSFFTQTSPDLVILDIWLEAGSDDGIILLKKLKEINPDIPVLMISGHGNIETAVSAIKLGAYDFIEKPFKTDRLLLLMNRALEAADLKKENRQLRKNTHLSGRPDRLIGTSSAMQSIRTAIDRIAPTNSRVLITGEAGTGKDIAARLIHLHSKRADGPFMVLNCAVMSPDRLENELFGVEDLSTGRLLQKGILEMADGGTLLLDEVADMPLETQGKIVRALQEETFLRINGSQPVSTDVRILATSNRDLEKQVRSGNFRQDLFYRLSVVPLSMPPLREHLEDIPDLLSFFAQRIGEADGLPPRQFAGSVLSILQSYAWPGNVRQLKNVIESIMIMLPSDRQVVERADLPRQIINALFDKEQSPIASETGTFSALVLSMPLKDAREQFEKKYLTEQMIRFSGHISRMAKHIGMERTALHRKLKSLNLLHQENSTTDGEDALSDTSNRKAV